MGGEGGGEGCLNVGEWGHDMLWVFLVFFRAGREIAPVPEVELQGSARHGNGHKAIARLHQLRCAYSKSTVKARGACREACGWGGGGRGRRVVSFGCGVKQK